MQTVIVIFVKTTFIQTFWTQLFWGLYFFRRKIFLDQYFDWFKFFGPKFWNVVIPCLYICFETFLMHADSIHNFWKLAYIFTYLKVCFHFKKYKKLMVFTFFRCISTSWSHKTTDKHIRQKTLNSKFLNNPWNILHHLRLQILYRKSSTKMKDKKWKKKIKQKKN